MGKGERELLQEKRMGTKSESSKWTEKKPDRDGDLLP